jgi:predicted PurR-regulated permease PerM
MYSCACASCATNGEAMNAEHNSQVLRRWFTIGAVVVVLWAVLLILWPLRIPIVWAAILAFLLHPLQEILSRRFGNRRGAAAGVITALTPLALFIPLTLLGMAFAQQVGVLTASVQQNPDVFDVSNWLDATRHPTVARISEWLMVRFDFDPTHLHEYMSTAVRRWSGSIAGMSGQLLLNTAGAVLRFFLMLFVLFFTLRDGSTWFSRMSGLLPLTTSKRGALFTRLGKVTRAVVYGCGLTAIVQGGLVGIGYAIAGLQGPVVFGVLASVSALLPFGGAALVWAPAALYLFGSGHFGWGIFMLVWGGVVSVSDNFIRPLIISRYTPVPTLLVFLGVVGGVVSFGLIGFILGPVMLVLATELLRYAEGSLTRSD